MFSQKKNRQTIEENGQETTLGLQLGIDIEVVGVHYDLSPWFQQAMQGQPREIVEREMGRYNNSCHQIHIYAKAIK